MRAWTIEVVVARTSSQSRGARTDCRKSERVAAMQARIPYPGTATFRFGHRMVLSWYLLLTGRNGPIMLRYAAVQQRYQLVPLRVKEGVFIRGRARRPA